VNDLQQEIGSWARETFPDQTDLRVVAHLNEEVQELLQAIASDDKPQVCQEIADCLILLLCLADRQGVSAASWVEGKMNVNRQRRWTFDPAYGYDKKIEVAS
jgi:NTP pyrophosphatase (non-canonical NTP hydrolase)